MARSTRISTGWLTLSAALLGLNLLALALPFDIAPPHTRLAHCAASEQTAPEQAHAASNATPTARERHLARLGAPRWHDQDLRGQGVKVAILDSGFRGYRAFLGKGLPRAVAVRSFRNDHDLEARDSQHGILCGEIIHALAPDAELLFANWEPDSPKAFLEAVRWAKSEGARVISCSLIMPSWSDGEGGGDVHRALQAHLGDGDEIGDLLFFASAGNTAQRHWSGSPRPDERGWHQWRAGEAWNALSPWGRERVAIEVYGPAHQGYELHVFNTESGTEVGKALASRDANHSGWAVVRFDPDPRGSYHICLRCPEAARDDKFHLVVLGGGLERSTPGGSIAFPGDGANVVAVGAVDDNGRRTSYSACGPNSRHPKPDFVATVPFPSLCREQPFTGTSAAAPQAAGLATLLLARQPRLAPRDVTALLRAAALDLAPKGHDCETGYGLIRLP